MWSIPTASRTGSVDLEGPQAGTQGAASQDLAKSVAPSECRLFTSMTERWRGAIEPTNESLLAPRWPHRGRLKQAVGDVWH
jgi:hypothetical protein